MKDQLINEINALLQSVQNESLDETQLQNVQYFVREAASYTVKPEEEFYTEFCPNCYTDSSFNGTTNKCTYCNQ